MVELGSSVGKANELVYGIQKATLFKRFSAWLFDIVILLVIATGFLTIFSAVTGFDGLVKELEAIQEEYAIKYNIDSNISAEDYEKLDDATKERYEQCQLEMNGDTHLKVVYNKVINYMLSSVTFSVLFSMLICELIIPIILKNGQTIGKKIFQIVVVKKNCVKVSNLQMTVRTIFGKYTIETMVPIYMLLMILFGNIGILGTLIGIGIVLVNIIMILTNYYRCGIHDLLAVTVVCDKTSQMIFESDAALLEFKTKMQEEEAKKQKYTL